MNTNEKAHSPEKAKSEILTLIFILHSIDFNPPF